MTPSTPVRHDEDAYLDPGALYADRTDELSKVITLGQAAEAANVSRRTINRWINGGHLRVLPGGFVTERQVLECERDRWLAGRQGRPGARVTLDTLT